MFVFVFSNSFLVEQSYNTVIESYENSVITSSVRFISRFKKSLSEIKSNSYLPIKRLAPDLFKALFKVQCQGCSTPLVAPRTAHAVFLDIVELVSFLDVKMDYMLAIDDGCAWLDKASGVWLNLVGYDVRDIDAFSVYVINADDFSGFGHSDVNISIAGIQKSHDVFDQRSSSRIFLKFCFFGPL